MLMIDIQLVCNILYCDLTSSRTNIELLLVTMFVLGCVSINYKVIGNKNKQKGVF